MDQVCPPASCEFNFRTPVSQPASHLRYQSYALFAAKRLAMNQPKC